MLPTNDNGEFNALYIKADNYIIILIEFLLDFRFKLIAGYLINKGKLNITNQIILNESFNNNASVLLFKRKVLINDWILIGYNTI